MSLFAKRFHLTCAIVASFTCALWTVITVLVVFVWRTASRDIRFVVPFLVLAAGAVIEFKFYNDERQTKSEQR
jgi:hypothetical protein